MRKRKKFTWKKLRPYLLTEAIALLMIVLLSTMLYAITEGTVRTEIDGYVSGLDVLKDANTNNDADIMTKIQYLRSTLNYDEDYNDCYVVSLLEDCFDAEAYRNNGGNEQGINLDGLYLEGTYVYLKAQYMEEDEILEAHFWVQKECIWDLKKYFSKEDIKKLADFITVNPWWRPTVDELRGRETQDGHFIITGMTLTDEGTLTLRSQEFKESDEILKTKYQTESGRRGEVRLSLAALKQNSELSGRLEWFRSEEPDDDRYYYKVLNYSDPYYTWLGYDQRITEIQEAGNGEISYVTRGENTTTPNIVLYVLFDRDQIIWNKASRKILCTVIYIQLLAIGGMALLYVGLRKSEERKQLRDTFVNAMAHELKTPAAVVRNTAEYLATGAKPEKQGHYIEVLTRESESMDTLLNRMLTYTQVLDGKIELNPVETDWNSITDRVIASYSDLIAERQMKVEFAVRTAERPVCDPDLIGMVIDNLISNAVRHGEPGSTIIVQTAEQRFMVWNKADPLTEEELEKLWSPMFQTERRSKDSETGGMGLAISASILDRHGASYDAYNQDDGLLFRFDFSKAKENTKRRRDSWLSVIIATIFLIPAATFFGTRYALDGGVDRLAYMCMYLFIWVLAAVLHAIRSGTGKKRVRKRKK